MSEILNRDKDHQSIVKIRSQTNEENDLFLFKPVTSEEALKTIYSLKSNKGSLGCTILVKILKMCSGSFLPYLTGIINHSIATPSFPDELKLTEVMSAFKKDDLFDKENYRPVSCLKNIWKNTFQPNQWLHRTFFSDLLTGSRRNHTTQHRLMKMMEKWKHLSDNGYNIGVLFMDLSKAFCDFIQSYWSERNRSEVPQVQYLAHSSSIFLLMKFSSSWLLVICVTTLMIILYMFIADIYTKLRKFEKRFWSIT